MSIKKIILFKSISILLIMMQLFIIFGRVNIVRAEIKEGDRITLLGDHECDSLVEYWMSSENRWSYKIVWYVYYLDKLTGNKYPAFCSEPAKEGVGTGYTSYDATIQKETDNVLWRILTKGYMGSSYKDWDLENDDDFYSATKIAIHSYKENVSPKSKYIIGNRSVDGNTVSEIQRRATKVLEVSQKLYEYGINGKEVYEKPQIEILENGEAITEIIDNETYYIQNYEIKTNKTLKSYKVSIENFVSDTKILDLENKEVSNLNNNKFKIAIPIKNIKDKINGKININDARVNTFPIFFAKSTIEKAQSYVTYTTGYESINTNINLSIDPNNCTLQIKKVDEETKMPVEGVTFEILDENDNLLGEYITNKDGFIEVEGLKPGIIKLRELKSNEKYVLDSNVKEVMLNWGETSLIEIGNKKALGQIKIFKTSLDDNKITGTIAGSPIKNVEFEIRDINGNIIERIVTDINGNAYSKELEIGKYIVKEIKTDDNYYLDDKEYEVEIKENDQIVTLFISNKSKVKLPRTGF